MRLARFTFYDKTAYVVLGPVLNKSLEVGGGRVHGKEPRRPDLHISFNTRGDHAGLRFYIAWWKLMFEVNLTDGRHWDWTRDRFYGPGESPSNDNAQE